MSTPGYVNSPATPSAHGPLPTHPMSVGEIFRGAVGVYKRNAKTILTLSVLAAVVSLLFQVIGTAADISNHYYDSPRPAGASHSGGTWTGVISTILGTWFTAALLFAFAQGALGRNASVGTSLKAGARRIGWLLLTNLLLVIVLMVSVIPGAIVLGIGIAMGNAAGWIIGTLGAILMLTCALVVGMRLMLAPTITVMEEVSALTALRRSWQLTRGRFLQIFGIMVIFGLLFGILMGLSYGLALTVGHMSGSVLTAVIVLGIIGAIPAIFLNPLAHFVPAVCYVDQRIRLENFGPVLENAYAESAGPNVPSTPSQQTPNRVRFDG